jgi:murein DD-endopeptidase MepM/ murein hydrolase activator NlpD
MHKGHFRLKTARRAAFALVVTILVTTMFAGACPFVSKADTVSDLKKSIEEKQSEIKEAENQKSELQSGLTDVKSIISSLEKSKSDLTSYVAELDSNLTEIQNKITELNELILDKEAEIEETTQELNEAIAKEEAQYEDMKARIKSMYERGDNFYFEAIISSKSFGDMINRADYIERLTESDKKLLDEFKTTREYVETCKTELEAQQELLEEAKKDVEEEEASLESLIAEKQQQISAYQADIDNQEQLVKEYEAEIASQNAEIAAMEKAAKELESQLEAASRATYDGGMFTWPAPSYTRISDDYGNRMHPTLNVIKFHNGIDLAAPGGSPILAAYNGTVVAAAYSSTMGNYIMIDHGSNLYTIYMHASALYVSKGATVTKGQKIAAVGTTGRSTGNHLHFSVRLNGSYVSPWNYLSK